MIAIEMPQYRTVNYGSYSRMIAANPDFYHYVNKEFEFKRHGPAIGLIGAIGTISTGLSVGGLLGGIMIAGGIFSGLGAITGNKTLSTIGAVAGLAGLGASAFTSAAGDFVNPFTSFGESALGEGLGKLSDGIGNFFSDLTGKSSTDLASMGVSDGANLVDTALPDSQLLDTSAGGFTNQSISEGTNAAKGASSAGIGGGAAAASKGGLLGSSVGGSGIKDLLSLGSGVADGFMQNQALDQQQPLVDARVDQLNSANNLQNLQADQLQQRMNNMNAQPEVGLGVNQDAQVFASPQPNAGKIALVMNGEVKYVTQQEYQAIKQGGLLNSGAA